MPEQHNYHLILVAVLATVWRVRGDSYLRTARPRSLASGASSDVFSGTTTSRAAVLTQMYRVNLLGPTSPKHSKTIDGFWAAFVIRMLLAHVTASQSVSTFNSFASPGAKTGAEHLILWPNHKPALARAGCAKGCGRPGCTFLLVAFHRKGGQQSALRFRIAWKLQTYRQLSLKEKQLSMQQARRAQFRRRQPEPLTWHISFHRPIVLWVVSSFFRVLAEISRSLEHSLEGAGTPQTIGGCGRATLEKWGPGGTACSSSRQPSLSYHYCLSYKLVCVVVVPSFSLYCGRKFQACRPQ